MTECVYDEPLESFETSLVPSPVQRIPVMEVRRERGDGDGLRHLKPAFYARDAVMAG